MNKFTFLLVLTLLATQSFAKIWRVNNNNGVTADFTTLSAAHAGASAGDTLHLEGSPNSYGGLNASKKLVIIGAGFFLSQNPNTQALKQTSRVDGITLSNGSEGSELMGLDFSGHSLSIYANDIVVKRNKFTSNNGNTLDWSSGTIGTHYANNNGSIPANNIIITQNYGVRIDVNYASSGILISNNYITLGSSGGETSTTACLYLQANAIALVQNNVIRNGKIVAHNSNFSNNIMVAGFFEGTGNLVSNNIANGTQFGTANDNKANVDMSTVFVGAGEGISQDGQWKLKVGSPAIGAGFGSTAGNPVDAGMYSGQSSYVLSGMPPVPSIYFFENQPIGSNTDPIDVTVKVKSNN
jgi:hypothetical protein